jgi:hypothetical protein
VSDPTPSIQDVADTIVARDVTEGRPGKDDGGDDGGTFAEPPPPEDGRGRGCGCSGCLPLLICVLIGLAIGGVGFVIGYFTASTTGDSATLTQPDFPVAITALQPEITTKPGNANFTGQVQILFQPTCNGKTNRFTLPGQLNLGNGTFFLDPQGIPPWTGTVDPSNKVTATGQLGNLTGTLLNGTSQPFMLDTQNFPCAGKYPVTVTLPSPITVGPSTTTGSPLAGTINSNTPYVGIPMTTGGGRSVYWPLVAGGGVIDLMALGYLIAKFLFGDDDDDYVYRRSERRWWQ